jgi:23S rRNA pseudouridine1911/1915/1917 synthase
MQEQIVSTLRRRHLLFVTASPMSVSCQMLPTVEILFEDNHLLAINKPVGLATMGTGDSRSVHGWACRYIRQRYEKPGKVFLGVVHRLDATTSGALVLARTSKAASRLSDQFRRRCGGPEKIYLAAVAGMFDAAEGTLRDRLSKDEAHHRMRVVREKTPREKTVLGRTPDADGENRGRTGDEAILDYRVLRRGSIGSSSAGSGDYSLIAVRLRTGRKHQIRIQFASRGHVVWGDTKYGDHQNRFGGRGATGIALHAASLTIEHPVGRHSLAFRCQPPAIWGRFSPSPAELEFALAPWNDA